MARAGSGRARRGSGSVCGTSCAHRRPAPRHTWPQTFGSRRPHRASAAPAPPRRREERGAEGRPPARPAVEGGWRRCCVAWFALPAAVRLRSPPGSGGGAGLRGAGKWPPKRLRGAAAGAACPGAALCGEGAWAALGGEGESCPRNGGLRAARRLAGGAPHSQVLTVSLRQWPVSLRSGPWFMCWGGAVVLLSGDATSSSSGFPHLGSA